MVKEERSLRTRRWPVRSGALRGALGDEFCVSLAEVRDLVAMLPDWRLTA
jgi:hypothetical protein